LAQDIVWLSQPSKHSLLAHPIWFAMFRLAVAFLAGVRAVELTADNWEEMTAGKTVFVKFQAPW